jgi:hypothetical protein
MLVRTGGRAVAWFRGFAMGLGLAVAVGCQSAAANHHASSDGGSSDGGAVGPGLQVVSTETWDVCRIIGPARNVPGVYGTDLGFSFLQPASSGSGSSESKVVLLFGDTLRTSDSVCTYPPLSQDDLQGTLPGKRPEALAPGPPTAEAASVCRSLVLPPPEASETTPRRIRLFDDAGDRSSAHLLDTGPGRTPAAGFSDGTHAFVVYSRGDAQHCDASLECPSGMLCTKDPGYAGRPLGECSPAFLTGSDPAPVVCRLDAGGSGDCGAYRQCVTPDHGVCVSSKPFEVRTPGGVWAPPWRDVDTRFSIARTLRIASAFWPDRPEDYATGHLFVTNKFINPTTRTIAYFDPKDPARNDYRPGSHTLLMWGRATFFTRDGFQALPFLLYQPLDGFLAADGHVNWDPRFFAGYDDTKNPVWSPNEADAVPVYGTDVSFGADGGAPTQTHPEFDTINQTTVTWAAPLHRWIMLYGGDLPKFFSFNPATNQEEPPAHEQPTPGAIHFRVASHPWGRSRADAPADEAWTDPVGLLTREQAAPYLACDTEPPALAGCTSDHDLHRPLNLLLTVDAHPSITPSDYATITKECLGGDATQSLTYALSGDSTGHLYAADVIDAWTEDVTNTLSNPKPGMRAAELYWHVSTWNPYQVILFKTRLTGL